MCQPFQRSQWYQPQCPNVKHQGPCWPTAIRLSGWSLLPPSARRLSQSSPLTPDMSRPTTTSRVGTLDSRTWSWNPWPSCSTPPIRQHQAQSYTLGTGVVDTHSQIAVGQGASTQIRYQQQTTPVYSEYSFVRDSACVFVPAQPHRYHQHKPDLHLRLQPHRNPIHMSASVYPLGAQQQICDKCGKCSRCSRRRHSRALYVRSPFI